MAARKWEPAGSPNVKNYADLLAFMAAVQKVNNNRDLLPNITLGFLTCDSCGDLMHSVYNIIQILSGYIAPALNYDCRDHGEVIGFIGDNMAMEQLLGIYGYSKVNYETSVSYNGRIKSIFAVQTDRLRMESIIYCLKAFDWNWVGIITPYDDSAESELLELEKEMTRNRICVAYVIKLSSDNKANLKTVNIIKTSTARVIIICGKFFVHYNILSGLDDVLHNITLILHDSWISSFHMGPEFLPVINGNSDNCMRCPNEEWPDEEKVRCIPKIIEYLSYEDVLTPPISIFSLLGFLTSAIALKVFILFWDTPVVKANNRTVSIILLSSTLLSFLCVFLFLGPPVDITCLLRQAAFGIFFTISLSCVLAKTITVWVAFKAAKPGSSCSKWVGMKLSNYIVLICSSVQVLICLIWLLESPPYREYDMSSYAEKIIIQCNEGSVIGFYLVLGYMGFLAAVSFVLAFMVRTLPDSFNEAKYITFSMLVFCSVWIAMIPAYLSTRGKYMVAVEIFAILTSSAGLLGCILFPKLYIILIKPEMNIILTSILLSFLCVFLFLCRPVDITCTLRQAAFGISISVSSVLAKTITVWVAFKSTKPGSSWSKWVGMKLANYVVLIYSSVQVVICTTWLLGSPPYQEYDMSLYAEKVIIQCNEGSVIGFYLVLGYMRIMAAVSFVLAFMVRTLPDSFNEAKYITFSMLVFCSVWISMIPAYLSTRGKYMVAVHIYAIITSSAGLMGCIFFPKLKFPKFS
ncbi:uncharacterized protein PAF06_019421 [Gastrophryne carolinensis]